MMRNSVIREQLSQCSFTWREASCHSVVTFMPLGSLPERKFRAFYTRRRYLRRTQDTLEIIWFSADLGTLGFPWQNWRKTLWRRRSEHLCLDCCSNDPVLDKDKLLL